MDLFAACTPGLEDIVGDELRALGAAQVEAEAGGVGFRGDLSMVWRSNLWLRCASRVLVRVGSFQAGNLEQLRRRARRLPWRRHLDPRSPRHIHATTRASRIYHSEAAAERLGLAISDAIGRPGRAGAGAPPAAEVRLRLRIVRSQCTVSLDSTGPHLHRRGYRVEGAKAPLRENLAAALLHFSGWDRGRPLLDPFCGSGTLVVEAALMAAGLPPGTGRRFAFMSWPDFDPETWSGWIERALAAARRRDLPPLWGSDRDAGAVAAARRNAARAGVEDLVRFRCAPISTAHPPDLRRGLLISNPPYGRRVGRGPHLDDLYRSFGRVVRRRFPAWRVALVAPSARLLRATELPFSPRSHRIDHGGLGVRLHVAEPEG